MQGWKLLTLGAVGVAACAASSDPPTQLHLAFAGQDAYGRSDHMAFAWNTNGNTTVSTVRAGLSSGVYTMEGNGTQAQYLEAGKWGGTVQHQAVLGPFQPSTRYYYIVGDDVAGWSEEASFMSTPSGKSEDGFTILVWGDMGVYNSDATRGLIGSLEGTYDWLYHVGDISYADDAFLHDPIQFKYEDTWNEYMEWMSNVTSTMGYMTLPGNHEAECHSGFCLLDDNLKESLHNFTAYRHRFRMPSDESGGYEDMWYSFNYGPVHFVSIDTETDFPGAPHDNYTGLENGGFGDQLAWLEADLQKAYQEKMDGARPWIIVGGHRPVYSANDADGNVPSGATKYLQAAVEGMFDKYGVDLYLCGHVHAYTRSWPTLNNVPVTGESQNWPDGTYIDPPHTTYIVAGMGGNTEGHSHFPAVVPDWTVMTNGEDYGVASLTISNSTHLSWTFYGDGGVVKDSLNIVRTKAPGAPSSLRGA